jgi:negative regulator of flagellin synthesis FlgM
MPEIRKSPASVAAGAVIYDIAQARHRAAETATAPAPMSGADAAGISEAARERARALAVVETTPEVRAERVRALRAQIASGQYQPDAREVARAILGRGL